MRVLHRTLWLLGAGLLAVLMGCTHAMTVTNVSRYAVTESHAAPRRLAVLQVRVPHEEQPLVDHLVAGLAEHPSVGELRTNWSWDHPEPGFEPDAVVSIQPDVRYRGSGWNLPITFPGFLVFAHAWNGYVYYADIVAKIQILDPETREVVDTTSLELTYSMRHCDFDRGFWAASGWWMPGYGVTSLAAGAVYVGYDAGATQDFHDAIHDPFGRYAAEQIVRPALALALRREQVRPTPIPLGLTSDEPAAAAPADGEE